MTNFIHLLLSICFLFTLHTLVVARSGKPLASFAVVKNNFLLTEYAWNLNTLWNSSIKTLIGKLNFLHVNIMLSKTGLLVMVSPPEYVDVFRVQAPVLLVEDGQSVLELLGVHLESGQEDAQVLGHLGVQEALQLLLTCLCFEITNT